MCSMGNIKLWRNEFAFVRKHLETKGFYVSGIINNWGITENGIKHLKELLQEVNKTNLFSKISQKAVIEVNSMLSKSESISEEEIKNNTFTLKNLSTREMFTDMTIEKAVKIIKNI